MLILESLIRRAFGRFSPRAAAVMLCLLLPSLCYPAVLTGNVRDKTTNKPDGGDVIALIASTQEMPELARTKTDAAGRYSIELPGAGMYLVRVDHQKVAYFAPVPPGAALAAVDVYDVAPRVEGITTEADMRRVETDQQGLYVVESYFVSNDSGPPRTQFGPEAYELYLPADAQLESSGAMGPEGVPIASSIVPGKEKGHYAFVFPLRPGRTRFQVSYHLPYNGSYTFQSQVSLPTTNLAVALPKGMKFVAGNWAPFQSINGDDPNTQIFVARNVEPSQLLAFTVSGHGVLPRDAAQGQSGPARAASPPVGTAPDSRSATGLESPIATPDRWHKYKWWILSGLAIALLLAGLVWLRSRKISPPAAKTGRVDSLSTPRVTTAQGILLDVLKQELFVLETERLQGKLSEKNYREQKAAFGIILKRALKRSPR